ncbi:V-type ATPase 116kDa subunit family protein [Draconibacterium sp. IB214405]|uniref:V-type ATP synthase subunit I n=1 Tax=Draconibacterium sp. IB214405 TaxID=3097352 RepID=UPI002A106262|nr:V-type ATPase 116kDa subunit family protein [Draconibacterium sp. IB214405]MDX8339586.1 V-type ATPase 116kDa subunit family protein [Draconibacterium sp. IB214405]
MKKLMLFMPDSAVDIDAELTALGQLGVLHIAPLQAAKHESIERVDARIKQLQQAISVLNRYDDEQLSDTGNEEITDYSQLERGAVFLMETVLDAEHHRQELENIKLNLAGEIAWFENWGNITLKDIKDLNNKGIWIKPYLLDEREFKKVSDREDIKVVGKLNDLTQVILLAKDADEELPGMEETPFPQNELENASELLNATNNDLETNRKFLLQLHAQKAVLEDGLKERLRRYDVRNVQFGGLAVDKHVRFWKGFIPLEHVDEFIETAEERHWGYIIEDPLPEEMEEVPTLVKTPKWAQRIQPVMDFMGLVPGYKEMDVSRVFMVFFTFFTGILVGDAGYGLVFLLITFLVHRKKKFARQIEFGLIYTLSVSIMFWGVLTGTYFGSEAIAELPVLRSLKIEALASFGGDSLIIQKLMFLIGAVHLTVGHLQVAWKFNNSVRAIAQFGWIAIIWGLFLIVNQMVLGIEAPAFMVWLFVGGALLVALFSKPGPNLFKGMISSIGNLPLSIINGFSDIISYIRLYAVGLSTVLMAASFNQMAIGDGITTVFSGIGAVLVLILGHGLNMILAAMAVLVHGVRLNMLEYAGHAEVEFSGNEYKPFNLKDNKQ